MIDQRDLQKYPYENLFIETAIRSFFQNNGKTTNLNFVEEFHRINQKLDRLMEEKEHVEEILDLSTLR